MERYIDILYRILQQKNFNKYDISTLNSFKKILDIAKDESNNLTINDFKSNYKNIFSTYSKYIRIFHIKIIPISKKHNVTEILPILKALPEYITEFQINFSNYLLSQGKELSDKLQQRVNHKSIDINHNIKGIRKMILNEDFKWDSKASPIDNVISYLIDVLNYYANKIKSLNENFVKFKTETEAIAGTSNSIWDELAKFFGYVDNKGNVTISFSDWLQKAIQKLTNWLNATPGK